MLKTLVVCYSAVLCLVFADVRTQISGNEILLLDTGNNFTELELLPSSKPPHDNHDMGHKKVLSIVVNPIIHNVAQGYGPGSSLGDKPAETTTSAPVSTTVPPDQLLAATISLFFRKTKFLIRFMVNGAASFLRAIVRFIICTFVPICGLFSVFGDEGVDESLVTPEGVARGLDFIEGLIENYHYFENATHFRS